jgi:signal transduction histidine kinase
MKDHHGQVRLESTPGVGTVAEIVLPLDRRKS